MMRWLRCRKIEPGCFSSERVITVLERGHGPSEFIVEVEHLREDVQPAVHCDAGTIDGEWWALIPTPQPETIPIDRAELLPR